ncbi:MAG: thioredoxin family protein [Saprospiraceae bacterium]|uniref:Thioredoxin family protein n=1 Tax=Candidatus Opimibacter skivensis TaxID=2982028 RepID=A0A9D7SZ67_9BACT|nr:thioredoxin family protein [Candidatus Opimibacter skivensis]
MKNVFGKMILAFFAVAMMSAVTPVDDGYKVGEQAADFALKNVDGTMVSLKDYKGVNGYIVVFTCNTCPYALMYEDRIIALHNKYASMGYPVVAINPNDPSVKPGDDFASMQARAKEKSYPFKYLFDDGQKVFPAFGATRTPHVYLLDANRYVRYIGAIDDNAQNPAEVSVKYLENAIAALKAGNNPDPSETKAIGCTIKVKS